MCAVLKYISTRIYMWTILQSYHQSLPELYISFHYCLTLVSVVTCVRILTLLPKSNFVIRNILSCTSSNIIYCISCSVYLTDCWTPRSERNNNVDKPVARHFNSVDHLDYKLPWIRSCVSSLLETLRSTFTANCDHKDCDIKTAASGACSEQIDNIFMLTKMDNYLQFSDQITNFTFSSSGWKKPQNLVSVNL